MSAYRTYVMGKVMGLDLGLSTRYRRQKYLSSWRILHVDGLEYRSAFMDMVPLPACTGKTLQFYTFTEVAVPPYRFEGPIKHGGQTGFFKYESDIGGEG